MSNEAAERLRKAGEDVPAYLAELDAALADERKATVERIKDAILDPDGPPFLLQNRHGYIEVHHDLFAILDAEMK